MQLIVALFITLLALGANAQSVNFSCEQPYRVAGFPQISTGNLNTIAQACVTAHGPSARICRAREVVASWGSMPGIANVGGQGVRAYILPNDLSDIFYSISSCVTVDQGARIGLRSDCNSASARILRVGCCTPGGN